MRKTKSRFGARLEPPTHVALQLYEGRELDIVTQAETIDHFRDLRDDLDRLGRAVTMLEAVDQVAHGARAERPALPDAARRAAGPGRPATARSCRPAFLLKVLALEGFEPRARRAASSCDAEDDLVAFDLDEGGVLLPDRPARRRRSRPRRWRCSRAILGGRLNQALDAERSGATDEVDHLAVRAMEHHLERRLRSVGLLDRG